MPSLILTGDFLTDIYTLAAEQMIVNDWGEFFVVLRGNDRRAIIYCGILLECGGFTS